MAPNVVRSNDDIAGRLQMAISAISHRMKTRAASDELTPTRLVTLAAVAEHGPLRISDLADRVGISAATMSRLVDWLVEHSLLTRTGSTKDLRVSNVALSPQGEALLERMRGIRTGYLAERISRLPADQVRALADALEVLEDFATGSEQERH
ncbi:MAG TPA: MarR family transcriptional regulator [Kutzneria sp.]|nr:MarR family transcriptional regulator [Kutzneria sp.]